MIGVSSGDETNTIGVFRRKCVITDSARSEGWAWRDIAKTRVHTVNAYALSVAELKIVVEDGELVQVLLDGEEVKQLVGLDLSKEPEYFAATPPLPANLCGVYHSEGAAYFRNTRLEPL